VSENFRTYRLVSDVSDNAGHEGCLAPEQGHVATALLDVKFIKTSFFFVTQTPRQNKLDRWTLVQANICLTFVDQLTSNTRPRVFVPGKPFQPEVKFVSKAGA
jgi:hypothetical protein